MPVNQINYLSKQTNCRSKNDWLYDRAVINLLLESVLSVSELSTETVGSRRELVANCVHTADATQLDSFVASASAVCIGHKVVLLTSINYADLTSELMWLRQAIGYAWFFVFGPLMKACFACMQTRAVFPIVICANSNVRFEQTTQNAAHRQWECKSIVFCSLSLYRLGHIARTTWVDATRESSKDPGQRVITGTMTWL